MVNICPALSVEDSFLISPDKDCYFWLLGLAHLHYVICNSSNQPSPPNNPALLCSSKIAVAPNRFMATPNVCMHRLNKLCAMQKQVHQLNECWAPETCSSKLMLGWHSRQLCGCHNLDEPMQTLTTSTRNM